MKRIVSITESLLKDLREASQEKKLASVPHILVVEDSTADAEMTLRALQTMQADTTLATSGEEALRLLDQSHDPLRPKFNLVFLDLHLQPGGLTGYDVLKEIKARDKKVHVVIVSGQANEELLKAFTEGLTGYMGIIQKPLQEMDVKEIFEKHRIGMA